MYNPAPFRWTEPTDLRDAIRRIAAGDLVTVGPEGPEATFLPWLVDDDLTTLRGHLARPNPQWHRAGAARALVRFHGPDGYVSPGWYPSKAEHDRVVPTWNYEVIEVRGTLRVHDDPEWVRHLVTDLTDRHEADRPLPWRVDDAPGDYVDGLLRAIVGVEVLVDAVEGKRKLSQNRPEADRLGVVAGLERAGEARLAAAMNEPGRSGPAAPGPAAAAPAGPSSP